MHTRTRAFFATIAALSFSLPCWADTPPFTPEQLAYIAQLLARQKQEVRDEVRRELQGNQPDHAVAQEGAGTPNRVVADAPQKAPRRAPAEHDYDFGADASALRTPDDAFRISAASNTQIDQILPARAPQPRAGGISSQAAYYYSRPTLAVSDIQEPKNSVQIQSSTAGSQATLLLTVAQNHAVDEDSGKLWSRLFTVKATTPFDDKKNRADFATLDGLATGLSVKVGFNKTWSRLKDEATELDREDLRKLAIATCTDPDRKASCLDAVAKGWEVLLPRAFKWGHALDVHVGGARNGFDYFDPIFTKVSDTRFSWLVGGSYGAYNQKRTQFYAAGFDFVRGYAAAKEQIFCPPGSGPANLECLQGRFAPPKNDVSRLLYLETRQIWGWPFSVRLTRDLARDETGIDVPIYFAQNKDKKFDGGFRMGWTTTDHFQAGVFVGTSFDMPER